MSSHPVLAKSTSFPAGLLKWRKHDPHRNVWDVSTVNVGLLPHVQKNTKLNTVAPRAAVQSDHLLIEAHICSFSGKMHDCCFSLQLFVVFNLKTKTIGIIATSRGLSLQWLSAIPHDLMQKTISSPLFLLLTASTSKTTVSTFTHLRRPEHCTKDINLLLSCGRRGERCDINNTEDWENR